MPDDWFVTYTGKRIEVTRPDPSAVDITDIAHALSHLCRFGGHVTRFVSVAEHSVRVSRAVPPNLTREALLHDAAEAYIGDVIKPLKDQLPRYQDLEAAWELAIATAFGVRAADLHHAAVKTADRRDLLSARRDLGHPSWMTHVWNEDRDGLSPLPQRVTGMTPMGAKELYLSAWRSAL